MRANALICALLLAALSAAAVADGPSVEPWEQVDSMREPVIRTGARPLSPASRAGLDPRISSMGEAGGSWGERFDPPCELECSACWEHEGEVCGDDYEDTVNGGCNSSPEVFWPVSPAFGPVTICGQGGNYMYGGSQYRDTDWYELTFTESREITVTCLAEFPVNLYLIDAAPGCASITIVAQDSRAACEEASLTHTVSPGTWWVWVGCSEFNDWPCDSDYLLTIHGYDYECVIDCPGGVPVEDEPPLETDYVDMHNGGCNSVPAVFQPLEPGVGTVLHCGVGGYYDFQGTCYRDTDWYELVLDQPREVTVCAAAEFPLQLEFIHPQPDCSYFVPGEMVFPAQCEEQCIVEVLDPGVHWLFIAPQFGAYVRPDARYLFSVEGYTTPVERRSWGLIKSIYR